MKKTKSIYKVLILSLVLIIICTTVLAIVGNTYILKIPNIHGENSIDDFTITINDSSIIELVDKHFENDTLLLKVKSLSKGKAYLSVDFKGSDTGYLGSFYVHNLGIITFNEFLGNSTGAIIIPISILILFLFIIILLIKKYKLMCKENMYQYKNIAYLGIIIFLSVSFISQIIALTNFKGLISMINNILSLFSFTTFLLPIAFVLSILMIISNISLIRKEGFKITNLLGIILSLGICFASILPEIMYRALYSATWIDIHNQNGIGVYLYNFVETTILFTITYIECVLIGTIIMSIKAAKHIPEFDKDAIVILGCQIKKDGTLTNLLKGRVDRAIEFAEMQKEKKGKEILFVPSGGKGADEVIAEGDAMKNYLLEQGINENNILVDNKSKNTYENIKFSNELIKSKIKEAKIAFSTTNYRVFRAGIIATNQNIDIEGIGSKTKSYFWINAFIREFIATLVSERKKHIIVVLFCILLVLGTICLQYFSNIF